jgi:hypothetical protein
MISMVFRLADDDLAGISVFMSRPTSQEQECVRQDDERTAHGDKVDIRNEAALLLHLHSCTQGRAWRGRNLARTTDRPEDEERRDASQDHDESSQAQSLMSLRIAHDEPPLLDRRSPLFCSLAARQI